MIDLAYTAGIIDGEGSIGIWKLGKGYRLTVEVEMCNKSVPQWLKDTFGGRYGFYGKRGKYKCGWSSRWDITDSKASEFLQLILPYLKIKKQQAELAIHYQNMKVTSQLLFKACQGKPLVLLEAEAILAEKMRTLNHA